jgi:type IV pilus assembly protein PilW
MVGLAIASLLLAGVAQAFFANTQTFAVVSEQSMMQENGRLALQLMGNQLGQAGHLQHLSPQDFYGTEGRSDVFGDTDVTDANIAGLHLVAGAYVGGVDDLHIANVGEGTDALVLRYQRAVGDSLFHDCAGVALNDEFTSDAILIGFYVGANSTLKCVHVKHHAFTGKIALNEEIIEGIDDMQVLYGVDADGNAPVRADKYMKAQQMQPDDWRRVVTVSVALLARAGSAAVTAERAPIARSYEVNDEVRTPTDNIARTVYSQTFQIRNRVF